MDAISNVKDLDTGAKSDFNISAWRNKCYEAMNDDFNTPILIAHLFEAVKHINLIKEHKESITSSDKELLQQTMHDFVFDVLGLEHRNEARNNKDFATSDKIRDQLLAIGIQLKDGTEGTTFSVS